MNVNIKIELWDIDKLVPYERNVKRHPPEQIDKIVKSITDSGWDQPIVVDADGVIIKGHGRRLAALKLGLKKVPVVVRSDLTPDQVRAARLSDNRVGISDLDTELLRVELMDLNLDLLKGIFDDKELDFATVDLGAMNTGVFINDIDGAVDEQQEAIDSKISANAEKRIPLIKAMGFKDIKGEDEIHVSRFIADIEAKTGLKGDEAFVSFVKNSLMGISHA